MKFDSDQLKNSARKAGTSAAKAAAGAGRFALKSAKVIGVTVATIAAALDWDADESSVSARFEDLRQRINYLPYEKQNDAWQVVARALRQADADIDALESNEEGAEDDGAEPQ